MKEITTTILLGILCTSASLQAQIISDFDATNPMTDFTFGDGSWVGNVDSSGTIQQTDWFDGVSILAKQGGGGISMFSAIDADDPGPGEMNYFAFDVRMDTDPEGGVRPNGAVNISVTSGAGAMIWQFTFPGSGADQWFRFALTPQQQTFASTPPDIDFVSPAMSGSIDFNSITEFRITGAGNLADGFAHSFDLLEARSAVLGLVPEPHEYAAIAGLALLGFAVYRRHETRRARNLSAP